MTTGKLNKDITHTNYGTKKLDESKNNYGSARLQYFVPKTLKLLNFRDDNIQRWSKQSSQHF